MELNKIKFTPKSNAFADVYSKATGMPFIGELMCAAAGNGGGNDENSVWYAAYSDSEGTIETSRGTGEITGVMEDGYQEGILLTNNNYPQLVGQHIWVSEDAAVDDGNAWPIYIKYEGQFVPYDNLYVKFFSTNNPEENN